MKFHVNHPDPRFSGEIVGVAFADGAATVDTGAEGGHAAYAYFQRAAYSTWPYEEPAAEPAADVQEPEGDPFDPAGHTVDEVLTYLATADEDERARVLAAEAHETDGKSRKTILGDAEKGDQS